MSDSPVREIVPDVPEGLEKGLENYWYPIAQSDELGRDKPLGVTVLGRELALWRDGNGAVCAVQGRCPHRNAELAIGRVLDGRLQCLFHGLRFDGDGRCALIPWEPEDSRLREEISVPAYPADERGGYIWVYVGDAAAFPPPPLADELPEELLDEERFVWFRFPTEIWEANWLLTLDGQDAYHPVTLHAGSQSVAAADGQDVVPLAERRVKIVETAYIKGRMFGPPEPILDLLREVEAFEIGGDELRYWEIFNYFKAACANIATLKVFNEGRNYGLNMVAIGTGGFLGFTRRTAEALRTASM